MWQSWLDSFVVHAQITGGGGGGSTSIITNPLRVGTLREFIDLLLQVVVQVGLPLLALAFIYVGYLFVKAQGGDGLKQAKQALLHTVIGAAIILGAAVISEAIQATITQLQ